MVTFFFDFFSCLACFYTNWLVSIIKTKNGRQTFALEAKKAAAAVEREEVGEVARTGLGAAIGA